jgi:hypothetical protein
MKQKTSNSHSSYPIAEGLGRLEFIKRVSHAITKELNDSACTCPPEARDQWKEMSQDERLAFVTACLECFYWIYISRKKRDQSIPYPSWEGAAIYQQVKTAAGFCMFILGTEFEQQEYEGNSRREAPSTDWIN